MPSLAEAPPWLLGVGPRKSQLAFFLCLRISVYQTTIFLGDSISGSRPLTAKKSVLWVNWFKNAGAHDLTVRATRHIPIASSQFFGGYLSLFRILDLLIYDTTSMPQRIHHFSRTRALPDIGIALN